MSLRIGIDGRYLQDHFPGIGRYTFHLVKELAKLDGPETFVVFYDPSAVNSRFDLRSLEGARVVLWPLAIPPFSLQSQISLPLALRRARVDIFHSPHYPLPLLAHCRLVCTIHDAIPLKDPTYMPSGSARLVYRLALLLAVARCKALIADSATSREELVRYLKIAPYRVRVVYLGVDIPSPELAGAETKRCILYVGTNKPHKNLPRLVRAYAKAGVSLPLVIAGGQDPRFPEARQEAEALGLGDRVRFLGYVGENELRELYRSAELFVFPSLVEGFGLPALEALAYGVPVVASDHPAIVEVVGEAALLVNPLDTDSLASAMTRVLGDRALAHDLSSKGRERAALFSWRKTAEACLCLYREIGLRR
ncbi:MAG: glycosyltransferase family 1 protein [Dehalococcoidia bacterium]|nr:glycosyltransferase family 1 protein [Dehalococcoidia bacterium]